MIIETKAGSRVVKSDNQSTSREWTSVLFVNHGETCTTKRATHKTQAGAIRWAKKVLEIS